MEIRYQLTLVGELEGAKANREKLEKEFVE